MAKKKKTTPAPPDSYYEDLLKYKVSAGLSLEEATEVTARQRAEDMANGFSLGDETDIEPDPAAGQ